MGIGDELMVAGEARRRASCSPSRKFLALDKRGAPKWNDLWNYTSHMARPGEPHEGTIPYVNGRRAYIVDETSERRTFREYHPYPAQLLLDETSKRLAVHGRNAVVFNPTIKDRAPVNKQWPLARWEALIYLVNEVEWVQVGAVGAGNPRIRGARLVECSRFTHACGILSGARAAVLHEGALHHAAAALSTPSVVIRGGYISPKVTGYEGQVDLYVEDERYPYGCGMRVPCKHCEESMSAITVEVVAEALRNLLRSKSDATTG